MSINLLPYEKFVLCYKSYVFPDGWKTWRSLSFFIALPGIALCMLNVGLGLKESHDEPPPFVAWDHMRIRNKVSVLNELV